MKAIKFICLFISATLLCIAHADTSSNLEVNPERKAIAFSLPSNAVQWQCLKTFFQENGYLWIKDFFTPQQVQILQNWSDELNTAALNNINLPTPKYITDNLIIVPESSSSLVCRVEDMFTFNPDLKCFIEGTVTDFITDLTKKTHVVYKDKLNFKWPGGGAFLPHQDFPAYQHLPPRNHITAMVSIDPATIKNGCLYIAHNWTSTFANQPDINKTQLNCGKAILPYIVGGSAHGSIKPEYTENISWIPLKTSPRDLVIFTSFVPHYSEPNNSNDSRRAMFLTYNKLSEGDFRKAYYQSKRQDPDNPQFHFGTPTNARGK